MIPTKSTPGHISRKDENSDLKIYMYPNAHDSIIYHHYLTNSQDMEATYKSIDGWIKKIWVKNIPYIQ